MTDPASPWKTCARQALAAANLSQHDLARLLTTKLGRPITQGMVFSHIANPKGRAPRHADLPAWADALHLDGAARDQFILLALLDRAPPPLRALVTSQEREIARLRALIAQGKRVSKTT